MIIGSGIFVMLVTGKFFMNFTKKAIADAFKSTGFIICLSADSHLREIMWMDPASIPEN